MGKGDYLGELEHLVLLAVLRENSEAYGVSIRRAIEERTGRDVILGAIYSALDRLEDKGLVRSRVTDPLPVRGGRARRVFTVTAAGQRALAESQAMLARMAEGLRIGAGER